MEKQIFRYDAKQRSVASSLIISSPVEPEQDNQRISTNTAIAPCHRCGSTRINMVKMLDHRHFAAIRCGQCDVFLRWQAKPENIAARERRQTKISQMLKSTKLTEWEVSFLQGLKGTKISPKQQEILNRIEMKVGGQV